MKLSHVLLQQEGVIADLQAQAKTQAMLHAREVDRLLQQISSLAEILEEQKRERLLSSLAASRESKTVELPSNANPSGEASSNADSTANIDVSVSASAQAQEDSEIEKLLSLNVSVIDEEAKKNLTLSVPLDTSVASFKLAVRHALGKASEIDLYWAGLPLDDSVLLRNLELVKRPLHVKSRGALGQSIVFAQSTLASSASPIRTAASPSRVASTLRTASEDSPYLQAITLPPGWEMRRDAASGRNYFVDHINKMTSWDDPRLIVLAKNMESLFRMGFKDHATNKDALLRAGGDVNLALDFLSAN
jgi:hypothetical protein